MLDAGAVGINFEDAGDGPLTDVDEQCRRLTVIRETAATAGVDLFINARTDTYLSGALSGAGL